MTYQNGEQRTLLPASRTTRDRDAEVYVSRCMVFLVCMLFVTAVISVCKSFTIVNAGEVAIVVTLGKVSVLQPGWHCRSPFFSHIKSMSTRTQLLEQSNTVPTKEGLSVKVDTAILYHLSLGESGGLFTNVGANYAAVLIEPQLSSTLRTLTSESEAKALYTSARIAIQEELRETLADSLVNRGIVIEKVLIEHVQLPPQLVKSIELKAQAEQAAIQMQYTLQKERQEADRKAIEAEGISNFQAIVSKGISPNFLRWKAVEATEKISESKNAKLIFMGNTKGDLPVLLSGDDGGFPSESSKSDEV